jgi:hypothetical protein
LDALYETFDAVEARRMLRRLEIHYTPKHAIVQRVDEVLNINSHALHSLEIVAGRRRLSRHALRA